MNMNPLTQVDREKGEKKDNITCMCHSSQDQTLDKYTQKPVYRYNSYPSQLFHLHSHDWQSDSAVEDPT